MTMHQPAWKIIKYMKRGIWDLVVENKKCLRIGSHPTDQMVITPFLFKKLDFLNCLHNRKLKNLFLLLFLLNSLCTAVQIKFKI